MVTIESLLCAGHVVAGAGHLPSPFTELTVSVSIRPPWQVQVRQSDQGGIWRLIQQVQLFKASVGEIVQPVSQNT